MRSDPEHAGVVARFDNEIRKLKKLNSQIVTLAEKIIFLVVIVVMMISILIVIIC